MICPAVLEDIPRIVELGIIMHAESAHKTLAFSVTKATKEVTWCVNNGSCFVKKKDGVVVGFITGYVRAPYFSDDLVGCDSMFYLLPEHRHGITASKLISRWARWCKDNGAVQLKPVTSCGVFGAERLYKALGFRPVGQTFVKDLV